MAALLDLLSGTKTFEHPILGHRGLNRAGLHVARVMLANALTAARRLQIPRRRWPDERAALARDGLVVLREFLPGDRFDALRTEAHRALQASFEVARLPTEGDEGFGRKRPFRGGFDRFDGSTLNRHLDVDGAAMPEMGRLLDEPRFVRLAEWASTMRFRASKLSLFHLVQGDERDKPDIQKVLHRDTFQSAIKLWYFLEPVSREDGPFEYVVGSHRMDVARLRWERDRSVRARELDDESRDGSFRVEERELRGLGLPRPSSCIVPENTLVLADVRGFHRRGQARVGATRLCIFGGFRPRPFRLRRQ